MPIPNAWRYRDYLVRAFNADLPYDRLILEHLAGDLLDEPRRDPAKGDNESVLGTAFFWMTEGKRSPVDLRLAQADAFDNRLDVMGKTFLGLTVACARCHDHKFDPITQEDYYGLYGYLKSSRYTQALLNRVELDAAAAGDGGAPRARSRATGAALARRAADLAAVHAAAASLERAAAGSGKRPARTARRWAKAAKEPAPDPGHPMFAWRRHRGTRARPDRRGRRGPLAGAGQRADACAPRRVGRRREGGRRAGRLRPIGLPRLVRRGPGVRPRRRCGRATSCLGRDAARPVATFVRGGAWAHGGQLSRRLQGTLRSPSFSIDRRFLHVLAAGRASRVNVVIEQFVMIQDPLYGRPAADARTTTRRVGARSTWRCGGAGRRTSSSRTRRRRTCTT